MKICRIILQLTYDIYGVSSLWNTSRPHRRVQANPLSGINEWSLKRNKPSAPSTVMWLWREPQSGDCSRMRTIQHQRASIFMDAWVLFSSSFASAKPEISGSLSSAYCSSLENRFRYLQVLELNLGRILITCSASFWFWRSSAQTEEEEQNGGRTRRPPSSAWFFLQIPGVRKVTVLFRIETGPCSPNCQGKIHLVRRVLAAQYFPSIWKNGNCCEL